MPDRKPVNPRHDPTHAAHEVILELARNGAFGSGGENVARNEGDGGALGKAITAAHRELLTYYRTLQSGAVR
ncbi:hypothetical protein [Kushneria phosphatilytica]|uniref:Uncharacterized protein n=1 Tax=Kushneria phosphatilytica TaxID=657387 RepID=A0A1S1NW39_9GAMM|nr:hypothetical protein [Kushneria phosphatilytica]OHV11166.1 hypothetical protein BH688_07520 [Kushneria phosphatilytica]QEL12264.1 hypothetical protein FY550_14705 [Kushneria phosphatilytica]